MNTSLWTCIDLQHDVISGQLAKRLAWAQSTLLKHKVLSHFQRLPWPAATGRRPKYFSACYYSEWVRKYTLPKTRGSWRTGHCLDFVPRCKSDLQTIESGLCVDSKKQRLLRKIPDINSNGEILVLSNAGVWRSSQTSRHTHTFTVLKLFPKMFSIVFFFVRMFLVEAGAQWTVDDVTGRCCWALLRSCHVLNQQTASTVRIHLYSAV